MKLGNEGAGTGEALQCAAWLNPAQSVPQSCSDMHGGGVECGSHHSLCGLHAVADVAL